MEVIEKIKKEKKEEEEEKKNTIEIDWSVLDQIGKEEEYPNIEITKDEPIEIQWDEEIEKENPIEIEIDTESEIQPNLEIEKLLDETILSNDQSRYEFVNDILQIENFLIQRMDEIESGNLLLQLKNTPIEIRNESYETLSEFYEVIKKVKRILNDERFVCLIKIKTSKKYISIYGKN